MAYIKRPRVKRLLRIRRTCLKCGQEFWGKGRFNRICERCTEFKRQITLGHFYVVKR